MIAWRDTIDIICEMFGISQQQLAGHLSVGESTLSRIKNGKARAPFDNTAVFNAVFNPDTKNSPAHRKNETKAKLLELLKEIIEFSFPEVREAMADCWDEPDYQLFVLRLLGRTRQGRSSVKKDITSDDGGVSTDPCSRDEPAPISDGQVASHSEPGEAESKAVSQSSDADTVGGAQLHIEDKYKCCRFCSKWRGVMGDELSICRVFKEQRDAASGRNCKYYKPNWGRMTIEMM